MAKFSIRIINKKLIYLSQKKLDGKISVKEEKEYNAMLFNKNLQNSELREMILKNGKKGTLHLLSGKLSEKDKRIFYIGFFFLILLLAYHFEIKKDQTKK
ncbi:MAG: hypothetical protein WCR72_18005 [Bacteroidota bacterium]